MVLKLRYKTVPTTCNVFTLHIVVQSPHLVPFSTPLVINSRLNIRKGDCPVALCPCPKVSPPFFLKSNNSKIAAALSAINLVD